jgi:hypothetical protein
MGCIIFEFTIWLLYGDNMIKKLHQELKEHNYQYFERSEDESGTRANVHTVVCQWMHHIETHDPECKPGSAISDLLKLVRAKLLVVDLPPRRGSVVGGNFSTVPALALPDNNDEVRAYRATAKVLRDSLKEIVDKLADQSYAFTGKPREHVILPGGKSSELLLVSKTSRKEANSASGLKYPRANLAVKHHNSNITNGEYSLPPLDQWQFPVDEVFARKTLVQLGAETFRPHGSSPATLCDRCQGYQFWRGGFYIEVKAQDLLEGRSKGCGLCQMFWDVHKNGDNLKRIKIRFERNGSTLRIMPDSHPLPVLSILGSPGKCPFHISYSKRFMLDS